MNVEVVEFQEREIEVGDVIQYRNNIRHKHPYYLICHSKADGYFVISLTGEKESVRYYTSIKNLMNNQTNIAKIYSQKEWKIKIAKLEE